MRKIKPSQLGSVLKGLGELAGDDYKKTLQKLTMDAYRELIKRSAVDTGFLRSNWSVAVDTPPDEAILKQGGVSIRQTTPNIKVDVGSKVVLYNNTAYAMFLETGTLKMRAQPMVEPTRKRITDQAVVLSKHLSKKVYDV